MSVHPVTVCKPGTSQILKRSGFLLGLALALASSGCVIAPLPPGPMVVEPQPVYVAPAYASPGVGWVWQFHSTYGWGWRHPHHGWHRGWR